MTIELNHMIVPARDKAASAKFFADIFGLPCELKSGHFAEVRVNHSLTLDFDSWTQFDSHHYAFKVSEAEFDAIFARVKRAGLAFGSGPFSAEDGRINHHRGGRGVYFRDLDGHLLELLTAD